MPIESGAINGGMMKRQRPLTSPLIIINVQNIDDAMKSVKKMGGEIVRGKRRLGIWATQPISKTPKVILSASGRLSSESENQDIKFIFTLDKIYISIMWGLCMKILIMGLLMIVAISGCTEKVERSISPRQIQSATVEIASGNLTYPAYLATPTEEGKKPAVVLVHSFNGLEPGYRNLTDNFAREGYVVISPEWQTIEKSPKDRLWKGSSWIQWLTCEQEKMWM